MSIHLLSLVLNRAPLQGGALLTLIALADWANDDGECWPSIRKLAAKARQSERNVRYTLHDLQTEAYITVVLGVGLHHTNHYCLNVDKLENLQPLPGLERTLQPLQGSENVTLQTATAKPANCNVKTCKLQPASSDPSGDPPEEPPGEGEPHAHVGETMGEPASAPLPLSGSYTIPADWWPDPNAYAQAAKDGPHLDLDLVVKKFKHTVFRRPLLDPRERFLKFVIEEEERAIQATRAAPARASPLTKTEQIKATMARALARHQREQEGGSDGAR